jgi:hypothetical protein
MVTEDLARMEATIKRMVAREQALSKERLTNWCIWKVLLPLLMLGLLYPMYRFVLEIDHPFARAFAHGDLILFSILVLLEAAVEGEHIKNHGSLFQMGLGGARVTAILLMCVYGFVKADVMKKEHEVVSATAQVAPAIEKMAQYSYFAWGVTGFAVVYSLGTFLAVMAKERRERLAALAGESE